MQQRIVEESYHSYFSNGYRAIHLVIDLWGVYASVNGRKFPYMSAEVQIKTPLNNAWANLGHDFVYKSVGTPNPVAKFVLVYSVLPLLRALSRVELRLFWNWMGWVNQYESKELGLFFAEQPGAMTGYEVYAFAVAEGGVADNGGVEKGMDLVSINGEPVYKLTTCAEKLEASHGQQPLTFEFLNKEGSKHVNVKLTADEQAS